MTPQEDRPSLSILSGPQSGRSVPVGAETLIGSDDRCQLRIPGISRIQATVRYEGNGYFVYDTSAAGLWVNDDRVSERATLRDGDILWLGDPATPGSVMLQCRLRGAPSVAPTAAHNLVATDSDFVVDEPEAAPSTEPVEDFVVIDAPSPSAPEAADTPAAAADSEVFFVDDEAPPAPAPAAPKPASDEDAFFVADDVSEPPPPPSWQPSGFDEPPRAPEPPVATPFAPPPFEPPPPEPAPVVAPPPRPAPPPLRFPSELPEIEVAPPKPEPAPAPPPVAPRPRPTREGSAPPAAVRPRPKRQSDPVLSRGAALYVFGAAGLVLLIAVIAGLGNYLFRAPSVTAVTPARARIGETITIAGKNLSATAAQDEVLFGDIGARVVEASPTELRVIVPPMRLMPGEDTPLSIKVRVSGREAAPLPFTVFDAPKIARLVPDVALPGDLLTIEGSGWPSQGISVNFGRSGAEIVSAEKDRIRVRVPPLEAAVGTPVSITVGVGSNQSAPAPMLVGRMPLILSVSPTRGVAGEILRLQGRGFSTEPSGNQVRIGDVPALTIEAKATELQVMVPRIRVAAEAPQPIAVRVTGQANVAAASVTIAPGPDAIELRFIAEPFVDAVGHEHATVGTELGPVFVLSATSDKSAAQRAVEAVKHWNEAAARLRASLDEEIETRGGDSGGPALALRGRAQVLIAVTDEDAAGYNEGWLKGKPGPAVTRGRLAVWWEALARDLVSMLVRGRKPERTLPLAPEARILQALYERTEKTGHFGISREVLENLKPAEREALQSLAFRVPPGVVAADAGTKPAADAGGPKLEGTWTGWEQEEDRRRRISVVFSGGHGTLSYTGGIVVAVPLQSLEQQKGTIRFSAQIRGATRYYIGHWDGKKIGGTISLEARETQSPLGTFEISQ